MRMWMVNPAGMCRRHLLGEHVELHMMIRHLSKGRRVLGFVRNNCMEPAAIVKRHAAVAAEMASRGYKHKTPITEAPSLSHLSHGEAAGKVDAAASLKDLHTRCAECAGRSND